MPLTDNNVKGNWGEQYISAQLASQGCYVRHVPQGSDSGIDLYCETTFETEIERKVKNKVKKWKEYIPFLHFWCQIKTSKDWSNENNEISFTPKKKEMKYWLYQPVPVFLFLVPDLRKNNEFVPYYIYSVFDLKYKNKNNLKKITIIEDLKNFLEKDLPLHTVLWDLMNGKVTSIRSPENEYNVVIPRNTSIPFEKKLLKSLLYTLHRLAEDMYFNYRENGNDYSKGKLYIEILEQLIKYFKDQHYHYFQLIGLYKKLFKDTKKALQYLKKAKRLLEKDNKIDTVKKEQLLNEITEQISQIENNNNQYIDIVGHATYATSSDQVIK